MVLQNLFFYKKYTWFNSKGIVTNYEDALEHTRGTDSFWVLNWINCLRMFMNERKMMENWVININFSYAKKNFRGKYLGIFEVFCGDFGKTVMFENSNMSINVHIWGWMRMLLLISAKTMQLEFFPMQNGVVNRADTLQIPLVSGSCSAGRST